TTGRSVSVAVTVTVRSSPSRSTTTPAGAVPAPAMATRTSSHVPTGRPAQDTMVSPGWRPATAPGAAGSSAAHSVAAGSAGRHSWTLPSVAVYAGTPKPTSTTAMRTTATRRFITGPPSMTTSFLGTLSALN